MANKRLQKKADEYLTEIEDARGYLLAFTKKHEKVVDEYTEILFQYQAAVERLKGFCVDNYEEFLGESVGPLKVESSRKADPQALINIIGLEKANKYIVYKPSLAITTLAEAVRQGELTDDTIDEVCSVSPVIKGAPKIQLDLKL